MEGESPTLNPRVIFGVLPNNTYQISQKILQIFRFYENYFP